MIDWANIFRSRGVSTVEAGPSTSRGNIYIKCPFCGNADQGHHMGVSIHSEYRGWACWKNKRHRGKSPSRLLAAVLAIPEAQARAILGFKGNALIPDDDLQAAWDKALDKVKAPERSYPRLPESIRPINDNRGFQGRFVSYLEERGYPGLGLKLAEHHHLHWCAEGPFGHRMIFPVRDQKGQLISWTGRSIARKEPRYLTLSTNADSKLCTSYGFDPAYGPINDYLFQEEYLFRSPGETLIVCEGPFDAMRVDWAFLTRHKPVNATCLWGKAVTPAQLDKLATLSDFYDNKLLMLDPDAAMDNFAILDQLSPFGFKPCYLPEQWEDPGDRNLPFPEIRKLVQEAING